MALTYGKMEEQFRAHAIQALESLLAMMRDKTAPDMTRIRAIRIILDLGWGKPAPERITCEPHCSYSAGTVELAETPLRRRRH
jgi:hypothetical protein